MKVILNVLWLVFGGLWMSLAYLVAGVVLCLPIITIPFAIASFRNANYALWPFGRTVVRKGTPTVSWIGNIIWFLLAGWWLALGHIISGISLCLTIVGIPLGIGAFKMVPIAIAPLGHEIVSVDDVNAASRV